VTISAAEKEVTTAMHRETKKRSGRVAKADSRMRRKEYEKQLIELQIELLKLQRWVQKKSKRVVVVFEGRDGAGKGGTISRILQHMPPRHVRKVALDKPTPVERGQWYFQRYVDHLPTAGEIVLFDRSWYNRAGVERVMGFCTDAEYAEFMRSVPEFEDMLVSSGTVLIKFWLDITKAEQKRRLEARKKDPLKHWKLSEIDDFAQSKWDEYTRCQRAMFKGTHQPFAPWMVIDTNDKKRGRLNCIRALLCDFPYSSRDKKVACAPEAEIVRKAQ